MYRIALSRSCSVRPELLLGVILALISYGAGSMHMNGIQTTLPRQHAYGRRSLALAQVAPKISTNSAVSVVVHIYWGENSCFNNRIHLDCSTEDTGKSIKNKLAAKTGVPVSIQKLYVGENIWTIDSRIPLGDRERVAEYQPLLRLRHDTKEWELNVMLELPVPISSNMKPDSSSLEEYAAALRRYSSLLSKLQEARKDPKVLMDPASARSEDSIGAINAKAQDQTETEEVQPKDMFILPNRRLHLLYFHDLPQGESTLRGYLSRWVKRQLPIDWVAHLKLAIMCYAIRASCDNERWVQDLLLYSPPLLLFSQTRPGRLILRSILYALPTHLLPKVVTNVLPAQIAQQLSH